MLDEQQELTDILSDATPLNRPSSGEPERDEPEHPDEKPAPEPGPDMSKMEPDQIKALVGANAAVNAAKNVGFGMHEGLVPQDGAGAWWLAQRLHASGFAKNISSPEEYLAVISTGAELGMTPLQALRQIAPINGNFCLWGDAPKGLVLRSGLCAGIAEEFENIPEGNPPLGEWPDDAAAVCVARRHQGDGTIIESEESRFTVADARRAGLWMKKGPWTQYPQRMLKYRARAFCLRDTFPDVLMGLYAAEEMDDFGGRGRFNPNRMKAAAGETMESRRQGFLDGKDEAEPVSPDGGGRDNVRVRSAEGGAEGGETGHA